MLAIAYLMKILSLMYLWTKKFPLNFESRPDMNLGPGLHIRLWIAVATSALSEYCSN